MYILQILKSRTSYTTPRWHEHVREALCISFKSWNQEHPIQPTAEGNEKDKVVYILQILKSRTSYTTIRFLAIADISCVYPSNLEIKNILYNMSPCPRPRKVVVYILQILKSRISYTMGGSHVSSLLLLCISFKSWNQEYPIQFSKRLRTEDQRCVYPSNLEIKNILYNLWTLYRVQKTLCISFKSWNQEYPIQ